MTEELDVLAIVTERLESAQMSYMVTGSMAANYYAVPRMTRDIDIVVELSTADIDQLYELFQGDFYVDRDTVRTAIAEQSVFTLIHMERVVKVDFIVRKDSEYRRTELARRRRVSAEGRQMLLARSGEERLKMGSSMNATARPLVRASVLARDAQASPVAVRRELFLRFYGHEFDAEARERILARLGQES